MDRAQQVSTGVDLGLAAVSFGCVLEIFGRGSEQSANSISAAWCFGLWLPILVGSTIGLGVLLPPLVEKQPAFKYLGILLEVTSGLAVIGCFAGFYFVFADISSDAGSVFFNSSIASFGAAVLLEKSYVIAEMIRKEREAAKPKPKYKYRLVRVRRR